MHSIKTTSLLHYTYAPTPAPSRHAHAMPSTPYTAQITIDTANPSALSATAAPKQSRLHACLRRILREQHHPIPDSTGASIGRVLIKGRRMPRMMRRRRGVLSCRVKFLRSLGFLVVVVKLLGLCRKRSVVVVGYRMMD